MLIIIASSILILFVFALIQLNLSLSISNYLNFNTLHSNSFTNNNLRSDDTSEKEMDSQLNVNSVDFSVQPTPQISINADQTDNFDKKTELERESVGESDSKSQSELVEEFNKESELAANSDSVSDSDSGSDSDPASDSGINSEQDEESKQEASDVLDSESKSEPEVVSKSESNEGSIEESNEESSSQPTSKLDLEPMQEKTERPKKAKFNPVGIPFSKNSWFSLFRYYQQVRRNESTISSDLLSNQTDSFSVIPGDKVQFLYIRNGCVNLYKHQIIILQNTPNHTLTKTNLRSPSVLHETPLDPHIPGFEFLPLFLSEATTISYPVLSTNLTWLFYTPKKEQNNNRECMSSLSSYLSLFFHSIHPLLPIDVLSFLYSIIYSRNM